MLRDGERRRLTQDLGVRSGETVMTLHKGTFVTVRAVDILRKLVRVDDGWHALFWDSMDVIEEASVPVDGGE